MPVDAVDEEGLPKNPDLQLMQWRFLLSVDDSVGVNKNDAWEKLLEAIKENGWSQDTKNRPKPPPPSPSCRHGSFLRVSVCGDRLDSGL